jgi:chitinase
MELKSLVNKKITFMYLFDAGRFKEFRNDDIKKIDVINLSFGVITEGKLDVTRIPNAKSIIETAHNNGVRVVLSIGGWGAGGFSEAAQNKEARKVLIDSIKEVVDEYHFDGVDLDWEYPTTSVAGITSSPDDRPNFTFLVEEMRVVFGKDCLITAAVPAGAGSKYYETAKLAHLLDFWHIMSYDMSPMKKAAHHTNLFTSPHSNFSADAAVKGYEAEGMPVEKMVLGIAFYGHKFITEEDGEHFGIQVDAKRDGSVGYRKIINEYLNNKDFKLHFDEEAQASWLYGNNEFISFDNEASIAAKCDYVNKHNLSGVMVWEYNSDDDESTLVNAIAANINK